MSDIQKVLKAEIARISRKEARSASQGIGKSNTWLRKVVADLKRRMLLLEKENKRLAATLKTCSAESPQELVQEDGRKARFTSRGIHSLRNRLRLSQAEFGKLLGTTPHAVYIWEKKGGALSLREKTKAAILSIRGLGAREAKQKLEEIEGRLKIKKGVTAKAKKAR